MSLSENSLRAVKTAEPLRHSPHQFPQKFAIFFAEVALETARNAQREVTKVERKARE